MKTTAAILVKLARPLELVELDIAPLKPGQVLVELEFSGVCHTQVLEARGRRGEDKFLPHGLGHEGTGRVLETGAGVTKVKVDDRVILSWLKGSGANVPGCTYDWNGRKVNAGAITTFQRHAIISENRLTRLTEDIALDAAAMLGCALPTGVGSVVNTLGARAGQSIAVFGAGGVGLCSVLGAAAAGCSPVIAVDILPQKLELARRIGATHAINARDEDPLKAIQAIVPGGLDLAVEASGQPAVMRQAMEAVRPLGGKAVIIGNAPHGQDITISPWQFNLGKQLLGSWGGDTDPDRDFPRLERLMVAGRLDVRPLLSKRYRLDDINAALDDLEAGRAARPLIAFAD